MMKQAVFLTKSLQQQAKLTKQTKICVGDYKDSNLQKVLVNDSVELSLDMLYDTAPRARFEWLDHVIMLVMRLPQLDADGEYNPATIRFVGSENRMIVLTEDVAPEALVEVLQKTILPLSLRSVVQLLMKFVSQSYLHISTKIDEQLDSLEDTIFDRLPLSVQESLVPLRRMIIEVKRHCFAHREALFEMLEYESMDDKWTSLFDNGTHEYMRTTERIDSMRERAVVMQETLLTVSQSQLNNKLYWLSIVTVLFLPLAFLTSLLGINVGGIPLAQSSHGFEYICGTLGVLLVVEIILFRVFKWF